ncbi:MAG: endopeptidase La, partial [Muribaculaceae bacterium]|nr:endopeptidase La [Muribaculaceae bacterium]
MRTKLKEMTMPALAMRGLVVFPNVVMHFDVSREKSEMALKSALSDNKLIFLTAQRDDAVDDPSIQDLYQVGVVAEIRQTLKGADNIIRVLVEGKYRAKLLDVVQKDPYLVANVKEFPEIKNIHTEDVEIEAVIRAIKQSFYQYCIVMPRMPKELVESVMREDDPFRLFDVLASNIPLVVEDKEMLLEESHIISRLGMLLAMISREVEVLDIERSIQERVREQLDSTQREYYLREQMKAIASQLGEDEDFPEEIDEYSEKILEMNFAEETRKKLLTEADRLTKLPPSSQEAFVIRNYLDNVLELPWNKSTKDNTDINAVKKVLDDDHYGLDKVKERILENISVRELNPDIKGQIICLVGPPGIGKTSIGKSIARAMGKKYQRISLGGVRDESDIRGHRKTYIGAMPGRIINAMKLAGSKNPLILLDEIDKMTHDMRGDPSSALLEVLDSEQNNAFRDHYIEVPFDLSKVLFVTTANTTQSIDPPLLDRMDVIELTSYTREEKFNIAKRHLVPKQLKENGLKAAMLKFTDGALYVIIDNYTREAGVRTLERRIAELCRKAAKA